VRKGLLCVEASRSRSVIHTTLGTVPLDERSGRYRDLYLIITKTTDIHTLGGIQIRNPSKPAASAPRLWPRGQWDWQ